MGIGGGRRGRPSGGGEQPRPAHKGRHRQGPLRHRVSFGCIWRRACLGEQWERRLNKYYFWCVWSWNTGSNQEARLHKSKCQSLKRPPRTLLPWTPPPPAPIFTPHILLARDGAILRGH